MRYRRVREASDDEQIIRRPACHAGRLNVLQPYTGVSTVRVFGEVGWSSEQGSPDSIAEHPRPIEIGAWASALASAAMVSVPVIPGDEPMAPLNYAAYMDVPVCNRPHNSYIQIGAIPCLVVEEKKQCEANEVIWKRNNSGDLGSNHGAH